LGFHVSINRYGFLNQVPSIFVMKTDDEP